jgi:phosphate acyltransferase
MSGPRTLALDAMGGDVGPEVVVPGAALALVSQPDLRFVFFGDEGRIARCMEAHPRLAGHARVVHTDLTVGPDDKPSQAIRRAKGTSMWLCIEAVKAGDAHAAISAGNTGALMALSKLILRPLPDVERPALAAFWPTVRGVSIVLDVGANIGASAAELVKYSVMGAAMARARLGVDRPTIGLLNVGSEEIKGNEEVRAAHALLKQHAACLPFAYHGFIEGDQIGQGTVDVVVVEGFAGNIALKTAEGTARQMASYLRAAMARTLVTKAGALLARNGFAELKQKIDPRNVNGALFAGLSGIAIKSHGGTDALGFASAIKVGYQMAESGLIERISSDIGAISELLASASNEPESR